MKRVIIFIYVLGLIISGVYGEVLASGRIAGSDIRQFDRYINGRMDSRQTLELDSGWNLLSLNVIPDDWSIESIFSEQLASGSLIQLKNGSKSFLPGMGNHLNTITELSPGGGYVVRVDGSESLEISGDNIDPAVTAISLAEGWNLAGYTPQVSMTPEEAFAALIDAGILEKVQSETESFDPDILPVFNTLNIVEPGKAYWVQVNSAVEFYYPSGSRTGRARLSREIFPRPWNTVFYPSSTIAYCYVTINGEQAAAGDEVGAFIDGECRGVGEVFIMGGNATTFFSIQGTTVETVHFNVWDQSQDEVLEVEFTTQTNPGGDIGYPPNQLPIDAIGTGVETWQPQVKKHSTTMLGRVVINGESAESGDIVSAFVDGECRGNQAVTNYEGVGYVTLLVQGETDEIVSFKLWDASEDMIYEFDNELVSDPSEVLGYPPDYIPFHEGELNFDFDLPESSGFITGDSLVIEVSEYTNWLFWDELNINVSGNNNINTGIAGLTVTLSAAENWWGTEILEFDLENMINGEILSDVIEISVTPTGEAVLTSVEDVPGDEGGWINVQFSASWYDDGDNPEEEFYRIYRWQERDWQEIVVITAAGEAEYIVAVETMADSVAGDDAVFSYAVEAVMTEGTWMSNTVAGYSVDNLAPAVPAGIELEAGNLIWEAAQEEDFAEYRIYLNDDFWLATPDTLINMIGILGEISLEAVDIHGNISERSENLYGGYIYGDVDHDLQVTSFDGSLVLQYFCYLDPQYVPLPWEEWRLILGDVDGNGSLEAYDTALILRYNLGIITEFPIE